MDHFHKFIQFTHWITTHNSKYNNCWKLVNIFNVLTRLSLSKRIKPSSLLRRIYTCRNSNIGFQQNSFQILFHSFYFNPWVMLNFFKYAVHRIFHLWFLSFVLTINCLIFLLHANYIPRLSLVHISFGK